MVITYLHQGWIRINTVHCQYSDIHFLLHFHKAHPMCPGSLARLVPEQRTYSYYLQYSADRNTGFVPLEYQHSIYVQYTHALVKALLYIVLPLNLRSVPYFCAIYAPSLELSKCGGSKTTSLNERSGYGIAVKSATTSGWTSSLRPSHRMYSASRISWKGHSDVSCQTRTSYCRSKRPISFSFHPFLIWLPVNQIIYCYKYFVCYPWVYGVTEGVSSVHPVGNPINHSIQFGVISDGLKPALEIHAVR